MLEIVDNSGHAAKSATRHRRSSPKLIHDADPGVCETWAGESGANACLILEGAEARGGPTPAPSGTEIETGRRRFDRHVPSLLPR